LGDARFVAHGTVSGTLYDLGTYPGLHKTRNAQERVRGELYELPGPDAERRLSILDQYEGAEFERARVLVRLANGRRHRAWAYVLADRPPKGTRAIPKGAYRTRDARSLRKARPRARSRRPATARRA
jgi:AIG2-like family.